ncbi:hypothetical protein CY35_11G062400 [Sphagnum magellanicum]|nr:hypothetical protein CY35_11G062400 [Sphagnum magellanicum]
MFPGLYELSWYLTFTPGSGIDMYEDKNSSSTMGPLANALELFEISTNHMAGLTNVQDALAIEEIKSQMSLTEWTGDPCLPVPHSWVTCSALGNPSPSIQAVNLSTYNITGPISLSFGNLLNLNSLGYISPEYATLGQLTPKGPKGDVYSFGILLLEIVSGCKNIDTTLESEKVYLVKWAWSLYETNMLTNLVDQDLDITISENEMKRVIFVALLCVQIDLTRRPMMSHALAMLQGEMEINIHLMEHELHESNYEFQSILHDETIVPLCEYMSTNNGNSLFSNHVPNSNVEIELSDRHPR